MKKLLLAAAMGVGLVAPAFAQSAATNQPGTYRYSAPSVEARNVLPGAPAAQFTAGPGDANSWLAAQQSYRPILSSPRDWTASNPYNYESAGG